ncbi:bifunctional adenosylcobinamide kinase/adenosylcobinamide-phosphate guanylyltransferase [Nonomuraea gerenzanensis]|uniref:Adenosylcobinamide kinase n=1 Tax=Nonomuraea gerenzanensis TaxID=93944 RepID=A0A1M4E6G5_9ACTN|nr:bifunctional adenosylcobinamide kinase/adenosylcobinamide-phosphate guanylyltransferase [Nonomuraea gerenzanensis]UBU16733.1 bifunctional adenosylcobinamide kinase/adenosylcobinamide-phosphate guanylyltransferase [Nonomuraea gerenzanensis]SBO94439.1 Adenosylcobinamide-phosphate guanylyltransferase [Nonomuraea gerenzanensis]
MKVLLTGTASATGWPEPGCRCASCTALPPAHRHPFALSVDGAIPFPFAATPDGYRTGAGGLELTAPDGSRLLCLPPGRALPAAASGRYDLLLLDLLDHPQQLGRLRQAGLVDESTTVVAIGLDHRIRSEEELARRLRLWGAIAVPDGTELDVVPGGAGRAPARTVGRALLLGGSRSGKSAEAELRLAAEPHVTYVATGPAAGPGDGEWAARVRTHRERRPAHWDTAETTDLVTAIGTATGPLLIDGLGTWLAAVFDEHGAWEGDRAPVAARCDELVAAWRQAPRPIVAVSDEVGMGVVPATPSGRAFRDALGRLNERLAAESEYVALVVAGRLVEL